MLEGMKFIKNTLCAAQVAQEVSEESLENIRNANLSERGYWAKVMEVRNEAGVTIPTPGLVVLEIDEMLYDPELETEFASLIYWLVTDQEIFELPTEAAMNLRLGNPVLLIDADLQPAESVKQSETLEPLDLLIGFGGLRDAERVREQLELDMIMMNVIAEDL